MTFPRLGSGGQLPPQADPGSPVQAQILESLSPQQGSLGTVLGSTTQETAVGDAGGEGHEHFLNLGKRRLDSLSM